MSYPGQLVHVQEGVSVAGGSVAQAVPLPEQAAAPDHLRRLTRQLQVPVVTKHLRSRAGNRRPVRWRQMTRSQMAADDPRSDGDTVR